MTNASNALLQADTNELEIVEFMLARPGTATSKCQESFGLNVAKVREIIRMPTFTKLPQLARGVVGIFNFRDRLIPIVDLACWMYGTHADLEDAKVVISDFNTLRVGFVVQSVRKIHRLSWQQVEPPEALENLNLRNSQVTGIIKLPERLVLLVDIERIVAELRPHLGVEHLDGKLQAIGEDRHVVLAEDSPMIRHLLTDRLREAGFTISEFRDGLGAWEALEGIAAEAGSEEAFRKVVDVVVTDVEMPRMNGYTLIKSIKSHPFMGSLPVLIFSSIITPDAKHRGEEVGADAQLSKPQMKSLVAELEKLLTSPPVS